MTEPDSKEPKTTKTATRLTVYCDEDASGNFDVGYAAAMKETGQKVAMRPSHIVGQLICAAFMIMARNYSTIQSELQSAVKASQNAESKKAKKSKSKGRN